MCVCGMEVEWECEWELTGQTGGGAPQLAQQRRIHRLLVGHVLGRQRRLLLLLLEEALLALRGRVGKVGGR